MKKYLFLLMIGFAFSASYSQQIPDAVRYSQENLNGTARFRAMSGSFGAVGGDLSSLNVNPAGSAIFMNNQISLTANNYNTKNNSNYFGSTTSTKDNFFTINQAGAIFVFKNQVPNSEWTKISVAVNYENTNNFDNSIFSLGTNPTNSIDKYFLSYANTGNNGAPVPQVFVNTQTGESVSNLYSFLGTNLPNNQYPKLSGFAAQQAFLGYQALIINAVDGANSNSSFNSNVPTGGNYHQESTLTSTGYNGKLSFNAATSYRDKLYLGLNLNSHFTDYRKSTSFYEDNGASLTNNYTVSKLRFENELYTYGTGFSFQLGAIAKITDGVRLGLAYESPTWYNLNDELSQNISAVSEKIGGTAENDVVNPQITNTYAPYKLQTPGKYTGSLAYVFGKAGLINIDYAYKDYGNSKFKPENEFVGVNNALNSALTNTGEVRVGGEYKIDKWSLRAGYRYEQSPYKNTNVMGDLRGYSGGLGYNFGGTKIDFAYSSAQRTSQEGFFTQGFTDGAQIKSNYNNATITLAFEL